MIPDAIVSFLAAIVRPLVGLLPAGHLSLPSAAGIRSALVGLDSLVPVLGVLRLGAVMLAALAAFFAIRVVVFLRYLLLP